MRTKLLALTLVLFAAASVYFLKFRRTTHVAFDAQELNQALHKIDLWMKSSAPELAAGLREGVPASTVESLARARGLSVPEEVYALYSWHNGGGANQPFFEEFRFLPAEEAFAYGDAMVQAHPGQPYQLPLFRSLYTSEVYSMSCTPMPTDVATVQRTFRTVSDEADSLTDFTKALAKGFETGAMEHSGDNLLNTNTAQMTRILMELRPDRQKAVAKILEGNPHQITPDEEMAGYEDLMALGDANLERLLVTAAERWSFDEDYSFTTMQLLAQLHSQAGFDEIEKLAGHSNRVVRLRAYGMLAFWWPEDGRKLNQATESTLLEDLKGKGFDNLDLRLMVRALRRSGNPEVIWPIERELANAEPETRIAAAQTLASLKDKRAVAALTARASIEVDDQVRDFCNRAVAEINGTTPDTTPGLLSRAMLATRAGL